MKTLEKHTIVYDSDCPMCDLYTGAFIKTGMLDAHGRLPYSEALRNPNQGFDALKASNEIALIDNTNGKIIYGIDSLFKIIGYRFPFTGYLFKLAIVKFIAEKFYKFISFNRKVIAPAPASEQSCRPSFNLKYRIAFLLAGCIFSGLFLTALSKLLVPLIPPASFGRELLICAGQLVFQYIVLLRNDLQSRFEYLGNMITVSVIGTILLMPLLILATVTSVSSLVALTWFLIVVSLMFLEHARRLKCLQLPSYLSGTWVLYRLLILLLIFCL